MPLLSFLLSSPLSAFSPLSVLTPPKYLAVRLAHIRQQQIAVLSQRTQVVVECVACLNTIFKEKAVTHDIISYIVVHIDTMRAMD